MMKKLLVLCLTGAALGACFAAEYVIGSGSGYQNQVPLNGNNDYGWSKLLFTQTEINSAGLSGPAQLTGIGLQVENFPANFPFHAQRVFLRQTSATSYAASNEALPDSSLFAAVFAGTLVFHGDGWIQLAFATPFAWDGSSGIEILWKNWDGSSQGNYPRFRYTSTSTSYRCVYRHADGSFPSGAGISYYNRPNLQLVTAMAPLPAVAVYPSGTGWGLTGSELRWKGGGGCPTGYDVYFGTDNPPATLVSNAQPGTSFTPALSPGISYFWRIVPVNPYGSAASCPVWSFRTPSTTQLAESFETLPFPPPGWSNPGGFIGSAVFPYQGDTAALAISGTTGNLLATPLLSIVSGSELSFQARSTNTAGNGRVRVKYSHDLSNWFSIGGVFSLPATYAWLNCNVDLSPLAGSDCYLGLEAYNAGASGTVYIYLDHVIGPDPAGSIATPELSISLQEGSIRLDWSSVPEATGYRLYATQDLAAWPVTPLQSFAPGILFYTLPAQTGWFFRVAAYRD